MFGVRQHLVVRLAALRVVIVMLSSEAHHVRTLRTRGATLLSAPTLLHLLDEHTVLVVFRVVLDVRARVLQLSEGKELVLTTRDALLVEVEVE